LKELEGGKDIHEIDLPFDFKPLESKKFVNMAELEQSLPCEFGEWSKSIVPLKEKTVLSGTVVKGFGRGSAQLGCPTANIEMTWENKEKTSELVPGVYAAWGKVNGQTYKAAVSIGWNPVYDDLTERVVEAYLVHDFGETQIYEEHLELTLISFIRAEALFGDFDSLILAIQCDILSVI
jgi:riboflavin kinase